MFLLKLNMLFNNQFYPMFNHNRSNRLKLEKKNKRNLNLNNKFQFKLPNLFNSQLFWALQELFNNRFTIVLFPSGLLKDNKLPRVLFINHTVNLLQLPKLDICLKLKFLGNKQFINLIIKEVTDNTMDINRHSNNNNSNQKEKILDHS